jgi:hypothetical protein
MHALKALPPTRADTVFRGCDTDAADLPRQMVELREAALDRKEEDAAEDSVREKMRLLVRMRLRVKQVVASEDGESEQPGS